MDYAVVTTKRSSLKVYTTSNSAEKNAIGTIPSGTTVEMLDYRVVNNVEWVKVKSNEISGWVILKHPSVSYSFLERESSTFSARSIMTGGDSVYNSAVTRQNSSLVVSSIITDDNKGNAKETTGKVKDISSNMEYSTVEVSPEPNTDINNFSFTGTRSSYTNFPLENKPKDVQNDKGYPKNLGPNKQLGRFEYDYETDYSQNSFIVALNSVKKSINLHEESSIQLYDRYSKYYNRFKVATPDDVLSRTFAHVFFTRPDCNIITNLGGGYIDLSSEVTNIPDFVLEKRNNPSTLIQLSQSVGLDHQFMMLPSNRVTSFECKDRSIKTDTYGRTLHGNSIAYGRHIEDSTAVSEVTISFTDDRDLHLFRMHQLWVEYISMVNRGKIRPAQHYLYDKCLDYACSAYYIVCAENGEDIIYWSKLYGVFPTNIPDSIMTWTKQQYVTNPEISINYQYSWKKDWNVSTITEFNLNSSGSYNYLKSYNPEILSTGNTWVGAPFIETARDNLGKVVYKLRFRQN